MSMYFSSSQWLNSPQTLPPGRSIFAVGDIHGHFAELSALNSSIFAEISSRPDLEHSLIYLGDFIDRGPDSKKVLEILYQVQQSSLDSIFLRGNHEQLLINLLELPDWLDAAYLQNWLDNGGDTTLRDLHIHDYLQLLYSENGLQRLSQKTAAALGPDLIGFLRKLAVQHQVGKYVFVHAGVDPQQPYAEQSAEQFLWIRDKFLHGGAAWRHDFSVVHGHSIAIPSVYPHRISVDAGCYHTGMLCAVQLCGDSLRFLRVTRQADYVWRYHFLGRDEWRWSQPLQLLENA